MAIAIREGDKVRLKGGRRVATVASRLGGVVKVLPALAKFYWWPVDDLKRVEPKRKPRGGE